MKAFLILEDGNVFEGSSIGAEREVISEIVFNTSMTGYLEEMCIRDSNKNVIIKHIFTNDNVISLR